MGTSLWGQVLIMGLNYGLNFGANYETSLWLDNKKDKETILIF